MGKLVVSVMTSRQVTERLRAEVTKSYNVNRISSDPNVWRRSVKEHEDEKGSLIDEWLEKEGETHCAGHAGDDPSRTRTCQLCGSPVSPADQRWIHPKTRLNPRSCRLYLLSVKGTGDRNGFVSSLSSFAGCTATLPSNSQQDCTLRKWHTIYDIHLIYQTPSTCLERGYHNIARTWITNLPDSPQDMIVVLLLRI